MKFQFNPMSPGISRDKIGYSSHCPAGSVVLSSSETSTFGGPFLVAQENESHPTQVSGCPNGRINTFLVCLQSGYRYNIEHFATAAKFHILDATLIATPKQ